MTRPKVMMGLVVCAAVLLAATACKKKSDEAASNAAPPPAEPVKAAEPVAPAADAGVTEPVAQADAAPAVPEAEKLEPVTLATAPTADETKAAEELAAKLKDAAQVDAEQAKPENARGLLILAATSTDPGVVAAALRGISKTWGGSGTAVDADCRAVVAARLGAKDHAILGPAIEAVRAIETGSESLAEPLASALAGVLKRTDDPPAQYEAASSLGKARDALAIPAVSEAFFTALGSDQPYVLAQTLVSVAWHLSERVADKDKYQARLTELLKHADPAVRGEACNALARLCPYADEAVAKALGTLILPLLDDENGFTRASAAGALAALKYKPALHALVKHLDDTADCTYDTPSWKTLWNNDGWDHHDGSAWDRVDDAVLSAIASMTYFDENKFEFSISSATKDEDIVRSVAEAKAWYEAHKADIPPLE